MSGGKFDYADQQAMSEIFGFGDKPRNVFEDKEISQLVWDVFNLIHEFDWYSCGDTSEENWLKAKNEFKKKWLKQNQSDRVKRIVDDALSETKAELYKTFALELKGTESEKNRIQD